MTRMFSRALGTLVGVVAAIAVVALSVRSGKSGLAHFVEHLTFGGTHGFSRQAFGRAIEAISKDDGALTANHFTLYYETVLPADIPKAM